ncbi:nucleotidyl transferase superfamily protein [Candidatus Mancarchaeum acidiphilum]|uniref:Probable inosine/xanthosine triphosphatase n=1 Tax=Candidatus Mancarchaeum acidiphilum TaxID=1920749 RepID=A0A218NMM0_9ARCH|nr:inosine/xanthosine triphosphatase [Candidatus Mancarchaeum acidiphilum]ASI13728.1 nucleotidyl transferase superfamily protein [Candidatus Mancarchaeum acidiphilum]
MIVAVGSTNKAKITAVRQALNDLGIGYEIKGVEVDSGVRKQPMTDNEGIEGAINRAKNAKALLKSEIGIGLEGSVQETDYGMMLSGWVAVVDNYGRIGLASHERVMLPEKVAERLRKGEELGPVMDSITGLKDIKQDSGTVGILTKGTLNRDESFRLATIAAFARIISKEYYE